MIVGSGGGELREDVEESGFRVFLLLVFGCLVLERRLLVSRLS